MCENKGVNFTPVSAVTGDVLCWKVLAAKTLATAGIKSDQR